MRRAKKTVIKSRNKANLRKDQKKVVTYGISHCYHCGGMLRVMPDEVSCVNCGRLANHRCERCMFGEVEAVV